uniref:Uncharacterized protein n=1 Tax=Glossina brevipalpis TaxID=37001 RepID=A0A1A9WHY0_9MUSC
MTARDFISYLISKFLFVRRYKTCKIFNSKLYVADTVASIAHKTHADMSLIFWKGFFKISKKRLLYLPKIVLVYMYLVSLCVMYQHNYSCECRSTNASIRIQRRFLWKEMDGAVDDLLNHMVSRSRVVKNVVGTYASKKNPTKSAINYLPVETTRVKYIFRNPLTKETKIIKMRPSKKVIKFSTASSRPVIESSYKVTSMSPQELRQMEKEQELIAEGRVTDKMENHNFTVNKNSAKKVPHKKQNHNDTVSRENSTTHQNMDTWEPILNPATSHFLFSTFKPDNKILLHTSAEEILPQPEEFFYRPTQNPNAIKQGNESIIPHTYEVTENVVEETVDQPRTYDFHNSRELLDGSPDNTLHQNSIRHFTQRVLQRQKQKLRITTTQEPPNMFLDIVRKRPERYNIDIERSHNTTTMNVSSENIPLNPTEHADFRSGSIKKHEGKKRKQHTTPFQSSRSMAESLKPSTQKSLVSNNTFKKSFRTNFSNKNTESNRQRGSVKFDSRVAIEEF